MVKLIPQVSSIGCKSSGTEHASLWFWRQVVISNGHEHSSIKQTRRLHLRIPLQSEVPCYCGLRILIEIRWAQSALRAARVECWDILLCFKEDISEQRKSRSSGTVHQTSSLKRSYQEVFRNPAKHNKSLLNYAGQFSKLSSNQKCSPRDTGSSVWDWVFRKLRFRTAVGSMRGESKLANIAHKKFGPQPLIVLGDCSCILSSSCQVPP